MYIIQPPEYNIAKYRIIKGTDIRRQNRRQILASKVDPRTNRVKQNNGRRPIT